MDNLKDVNAYRKAAFYFLKNRAVDFTQEIDEGLDSDLRILSNLPVRPSNSDNYNAIVGIKNIVEQRLICLRLIEERLIKTGDHIFNVDYHIDSYVRILNSLPRLPEANNPYKNLFVLDKEPIKKFNSPLIYKTNTTAIKLMHKYESCVLKAYKDPGSSDGMPITIG